MNLNGVIALILRFSPNSIALLTDYVTVVEARLTISSSLKFVRYTNFVMIMMNDDNDKILSLSSSLPLSAKTNVPCSAVSLR